MNVRVTPSLEARTKAREILWNNAFGHVADRTRAELILASELDDWRARGQRESMVPPPPKESV